MWSEVAKVSSWPLSLMEDVLLLLRAVNVYVNPFSSISRIASRNYFSILSVTQKLGISQKRVNSFIDSLIWTNKNNKLGWSGLNRVLHNLYTVLF